LDRYLARNAYGAQETATYVSAERRDNLMEPVSDLHRTRGSFGKEAANRALAVPGPLARLTPTLAGALTGLSIGVLLARALRNGSRGRGLWR
jgi:hypothetical protein